MTDETSRSLMELQEMDLNLETIRTRIGEFDPLLADLEEPALALEQEVVTLRNRLQEIKLEERRLEHSADDRRVRLKTLKERLKAVRNLREEAAASAELDLVRSALEGEEQEALSLLDQIKKMEIRLEELEAALAEARASVEPRRLELLEEQKVLVEEFAVLKNKREAHSTEVPSRELQNYDRIRSGGRSVAVAFLTPDGACGHCFGMVPLQIQNELRDSPSLIACEACGVLLSPGDEPL